MFIELTQRTYEKGEYKIKGKFLMDFQSGWEIYDKGAEPAHWVNNTLGANHNVNETYAEIKSKLVSANLFIQELSF
jgi:hypothetical protein